MNLIHSDKQAAQELVIVAKMLCGDDLRTMIGRKPGAPRFRFRSEGYKGYEIIVSVPTDPSHYGSLGDDFIGRDADEPRKREHFVTRESIEDAAERWAENCAKNLKKFLKKNYRGADIEVKFFSTFNSGKNDETQVYDPDGILDEEEAWRIDQIINRDWVEWSEF